MSKSFGQSFRVDNSHGILAMKVFCSWDFKVIKKTSVKLMSENICTQLKVYTHIRTLIYEIQSNPFVSHHIIGGQECDDLMVYLKLHLSSGATSRGIS